MSRLATPSPIRAKSKILRSLPAGAGKSPEMAGERWFTWVLSVLASIAILGVRLDPSQMPTWILIEWLLVVGATWMIRRQTLASSHRFRIQVENWSSASDRSSMTVGSMGRSRVWTILSIGIILFPQLAKWSQEWLMGSTGEANELVWITILQNGVLCAAAQAITSKQHWMVVLLSSFLMLFGLATSDRNETIYLVAIYGVLVAWWMMARHWERIERGFVAVESVPLVRLRVTAIASLIGIISIAGLLLGSGSFSRVRDGFMPTSGGQQSPDSSARQGVGDGEMLVAAKEQAFTFGPVDSDLFLESQLPTLYDLASDVFGKPTPNRRKNEQAVAINAEVQESQKEAAESRKKSREFSTVRQSTGKSQENIQGTKSRAVLHLIGRTPLHLRLESYDRFDGRAWTQSDSESVNRTQLEPSLENRFKKPWIRVARYSTELVHNATESIAIKLIGYRSARVVGPSLMTHLHIDQIDRPDFFARTADGQLYMPNRDCIPQLTILREEYALPRLHLLRDASSTYSMISHSHDINHAPSMKTYLEVEMGREEIRGEAVRRAGVAGTSNWRGVEAIVESLKSEYRYDPDVRAPKDCDDTVTFFLQHGAGPDYLFAASAAMLLRSVGYPCRLVTGFYASPKHYDRLTGQTDVFPEHLHTWIEVQCYGMWLPVETTPGFENPIEHRTWSQWTAEVFWLVRDSLLQHPWRVTSFFAAMTFVWLSRRQWGEQLAIVTCRIGGVGSLERRIQWTLRLMQWRSWLHGGGPRKESSTIARWIRSEFERMSSQLQTGEQALFVEAVQRIGYAPRSTIDLFLQQNHVSLLHACRNIARSSLSKAVRNP